jgi:hypothetical protein
MLLVYIGNFPKYILEYQFLILNTYHPYILYLLQRGYKDPWLFFEAKRRSANKKVWERLTKVHFCLATF